MDEPGRRWFWIRTKAVEVDNSFDEQFSRNGGWKRRGESLRRSS